MTAAPFILCAWWCAASPTLGGVTLAPGEAAVYGAIGWDTTLPTVSLGATAGIVRGVDLDARYDTRAGLAHDFGLRIRVALAETIAASLVASHGFFAVEEIGGIQSSRAPFGNGLALAPALHLSTFREAGAHVAFGVGATVRLTRLSESFGMLERELDPHLESAFLDVAAEWEDDGATTWLALRAAIPIQTDVHVIGFLPWITVGRSWELR